jgi:glyoxylase-like metal-dependent hydrolase (beta-lactamase superfamily II)
VNSVIIQRGGQRLAVYGVDSASPDAVDTLLLTHHRRDALWPARQAVELGAKTKAPVAERDWIERPQDFWNAFAHARFHDYGCQSTKILARPLRIDDWVQDGDAFDWNGISFEVLATPGYSKGAVSYLATIDGIKMAFTGDLIYGEGQILDLYSFQDAIAEADIRGYHGYAGRLAQLVTSLRKIARHQPDMLIPARGPIIRKPRAAIDRLIDRVQNVYRNYLSTNALHWYFKEDRMRKSGERVLGAGATIELMPYSIHEKAPDWIFEHATSRLLISDTGHGFLLDCGYQRVIDAVQKLIDQGLIKKVDGIFVTHYHDDHTDKVQAAAEIFHCPVYAMKEYQDILARPSAYHMPAMTSEPIKDIRALPDGHSMSWNEFQLTFHFFPGQTVYHGGLLAKRKQERPVFFVGDSFAPSGIDDYCLLNRNLIHENAGYALCFKKLRSLKDPPWIVNEHIPFVFQFTDKELSYLESRYQQRKDFLRQLFPWDDPNYGVDHQWAVFHPYGQPSKKSQEAQYCVYVTNHSPKERQFNVAINVPAGMQAVGAARQKSLAPGERSAFEFSIDVGDAAGLHLITADVQSEGMDFRQWIEAFVVVEE